MIPVQFTEAVAWFRRRVPMTDEDYAKLSAQARQKAFTVADVMAIDIITDIYESLERALEDGTGYEAWVREIKHTLAGRWSPKASLLEVIFRTNLQQAYGAGRHAQMTHPAVLKARPFWLVDAVIDRRTSDICRALDGVIAEAGNLPTPPYHTKCRTRIRTLTKRQANERGYDANKPIPKAELQDGFGDAPLSWAFEPAAERWPQAVRDALWRQK